MKITRSKFLIALLLFSGACTSGKNSPADSHPGSGSVKGGSEKIEQKDSKPADTIKKDSTGRI